MRKLALLIVVLSPQLARAGGFELLEQSPAGVGMAGAQSAIVEDSGAVFYNPARMTYIRGFSGMAAVNTINAHTRLRPPGGGPESSSNVWEAEPTIYGVQRIGSRFAVGLGGFSNFAQVFEWPRINFPGRFLGTQLNLTTITVNPSVAFRPLPWLSIGVGIDIVPTTIELRQALNFGGAEGELHTSASATGVGGNLGLYIRAIPQYLDFAFTYRSAVDLDFNNGKAALTIPPELASMAASFQNMKTSLTLPHNFTFGVGTHPHPKVALDFDAHLVLWDVLKSLTLTLTDPKAPAGTPPTTQSQALDYSISYGLRLGIQYNPIEKLILRIGGGFEKTPNPDRNVTPLNPDADRGLIGFGIGYRGDVLGLEASYLLAILQSRTSGDPRFPASYETMGHVITIGASLHFENFPKPINEPEFKH